MSVAPGSCVACGGAFQLNRQLATIPDAIRIAFDPARHRVWRICESCGEWNLLGTEAADRAMPELEARFAAGLPGTLLELALMPLRLSDRLELVRIGATSGNAEDDRAAHRLRAEAERRAKGLRWMPLVGGVLGLALVANLLWWSRGEPTVPVIMLLLYSQVAFFTALSRRLYGERVWRGTIPLSGSLMAIATAGMVIAHRTESLKYNAMGMAVMLPFFFVVDPLLRRHVGVIRFDLSGGRRLRISERAAPEVTLSWVEGGTDIALHDLPDGRPLFGLDASKVYRKLYPWARHTTRKEVANLGKHTEQAYELLRTVGGLAGLLRALEGFRDDRDGRVLLAELPLLYLVALDMALSAEGGESALYDELRQRALAAAEVAEAAEALEAEQLLRAVTELDRGL